MAHVRLTDVSFSFPVFNLTARSLKVAMIQHVAGARIRRTNNSTTVQALSNISFELSDGDRLGLIGHNGSGKSTLLRVLAGLAHPQSGKLEISGRVVALIERSLGINAELSGHENIELPLRLLGASTAEVRQAMEEIPDWTGLGEFINLPFRTYSDGMKTRLMFAISTAVSGDILVLDEWLSAGDAAFVEQAEARLKDFLCRKKILVLASHQLNLIQEVCTRVLWMEHGEMRLIGPAEQVISAYKTAMHTRAQSTSAAE